MAGLLDTTALTPPAAAMAPAEAPVMAMTAGDEAGEEPNATPEEQAQYDKFVTDGLSLIYEGGKVREGVLDLLDDDPSDLIAAFGQADELSPENFGPAVALGAAAAVVVLEIVRNEQDPHEGAIILHGGQAILEELADIAREAGIHEFSPEEVNDALLVGMDLYRAAAERDGLYNPEDAQADAAELQQADAEGRFFELAPQLAPFAGGAQ